MSTVKSLSIAAVTTAFTVLGTFNIAQAGIIGGQLFSTGGNVSVQILDAEAKWTSDLWLSSPRGTYLGTNRNNGSVFNLGNFALGQELIFSMFVPKTGNLFHMGPGARNGGLPHAIVDFLAPGVARVGFEHVGGSDADFNDHNFLVTGRIAAAPPRPPVITSLTSDLTIRTDTLFDFAATATDPDKGDILSFKWDFDNDGSYDDFTGNSGQWSFSSPGDHLVKLRVTDRYGLYADGSFNVKAVPEPTSILGLLAFSTFGISSLLKRKRQQKVLNSVVSD
ncbi:MAG: PKD domain-containing protein [Phormidium sp.]